MKNILYISAFIISILVSCQKKSNKEITQKDLKEYFKIELSNSDKVFIGKMNSLNDDSSEDFEITEKEDSVFVFQNFLESDNFDEKEIIIESNASTKNILLKYNIALHFNGTEKENKFIPLGFILPISIDNKSITPSLKKIIANKDLQNFISKNNLRIKNIAYEYYMNYNNNIPKNELKNCCITDYNNFNRLKDINENSISSLDLEKDLGMYIDYKSLVINIDNVSIKKVIVFSKEKITSNNALEKEIIKNKENQTKKNIDWKGSYAITAKAISLYNNKEIDLLYTISLKNDKNGVLSIGAEQVQDYWCEGSYTLTKEDDILHARGKCDQDDMDDFYLKYENDKYFIKSKRFINQDWQELTKE